MRVFSFIHHSQAVMWDGPNSPRKARLVETVVKLRQSPFVVCSEMTNPPEKYSKSNPKEEH